MTKAITFTRIEILIITFIYTIYIAVIFAYDSHQSIIIKTVEFNCFLVPEKMTKIYFTFAHECIFSCNLPYFYFQMDNYLPYKMRQCYYVMECLCKFKLTKYNLQSFIKTMININDAAGTKRNNCIIQSNQVVLCWCCKVTMLVNERLLSYLNGKESSLNSGTMIFQVQNLRCMIKINIMSFFHGCVWKNETVLR